VRGVFLSMDGVSSNQRSRSKRHERKRARGPGRATSYLNARALLVTIAVLMFATLGIGLVVGISDESVNFHSAAGLANTASPGKEP
jgi:hypothetical protein